MTILPKRQAGAASGGGAGGGGGREEAEQDHGAGAYQISSQVGIYETSTYFWPVWPLLEMSNSAYRTSSRGGVGVAFYTRSWVTFI